MPHVLGMNAKTYYDATPLTAGTPAAYSAAGWLEMDNVRELTLNLETGEADITTRANNGWRATAATLKDGTVDFQMVWDTSDAGFTAIETAWEGSAEIAITCLDGAEDAVGSQGIAGNFTVTNFSRNESLEEALTVSVSLKPSSYTNWWTVGS